MAWPTTDNPRTNFVTTRFTDPEASDLDWLALQQGMTRSEATRDAVAEKVAREKRKARKIAALSEKNDAGA